MSLSKNRPNIASLRSGKHRIVKKNENCPALLTTLQSELNNNLQKKCIAIVNTGLTPYHANTILPFDIGACAIPSESTSASAREKRSTNQRQDEYYGIKHTMNLGGGHALIWFNAIFGPNSRAKGEIYIFDCILIMHN